MSDASIRLWADVLRAVPDSRLLLKAIALRDEATRERLRQAFERHGIGEDRLELLGPVVSLHEHLSTYAKVDIALDTFPYTGTTTTCEALWMGVPVVTLAGNSHVSRVGASLLTAMQLGEWIATSDAQFVEIACRFAQDLESLAQLRSTLRQKLLSSPLTDGAGFTRRLESVYRSLVRSRTEQ